MRKQPFYPPQENNLFINLVKTFTPFIFKFLLSGLKVHISEEDLQKLKDLKGQRLLLLPNHPTEDDPYVFIELSRKLNVVFNGVAAREVFDWDGGLRGKLIQWLGAYSLIRGALDRESFKMTKDLLVKGKNPLVVFIEGEISNENDTLIPFEPGVIQLAFWAQEELIVQDCSLTPSIHVAPIALKYLYEGKAEQLIAKSIGDLENALGLTESNQSNYQRLLLIGEKILAIQEKRLNLPSQGLSLDERIEKVKIKIIEKMEHFLDIKALSNASLLDRIRAIRNKIDKQIYAYSDEPSFSDYELRMLDHQRESFAEFYVELDRLINFLVLHDGYIAEKATPERYVEVIRRIENEVYGKAKINPPRTAFVQVGEIVNLKDHFQSFKQDKKKTAQEIVSGLETNMQTMLLNAEKTFKTKAAH